MITPVMPDMAAMKFTEPCCHGVLMQMVEFLDVH